LKAHLNKPSGSANAIQREYEDVPAEVRELAVRSAHIMQRQVAGVDIVQDKHTKKWYVLEVNNAPQLRSGSFVDEKAKAVAQLFDKELNR
jgi:glutathione synthase/RimK-type ligase-like ATP-grasp enzyme